MAVDDPGFWGGIGAAGVTGGFAWLVRKMMRKESLEERLQRWQEDTVKRMAAELDGYKGDRERLIVVEHCLRILVVEMMRIEPQNPVLRQVGLMLASALPLDEEIPEDMRELLARVSRTNRARRSPGASTAGL